MRWLFLILIVFTFGIAPIGSQAWANECGEECLDASECTNPNCPVCVGICVPCYYLGDSTGCGDPTTGATTACFWMGSECIDVASVPEVPIAAVPWILLALACLAAFVARRRQKPALRT